MELYSFNQNVLCVHVRTDFLSMLHRFTQIGLWHKKHKIEVFILKDTDYTKVNPTGFLILVCAGVCDSNVLFLNYYTSSLILNELKLNWLFHFLTSNISSYVQSFDVEPDSFTVGSNSLINIGSLQTLYIGVCVHIILANKKKQKYSFHHIVFVKFSGFNCSLSIIRFTPK